MNVRLPVRASLSFFLAACGAEGSAELLLPEEVEVEWEAAYNARLDGLGALVPVDVMVYDSATGVPQAEVALHAFTTDAASLALPIDGVVFVEEGLGLSGVTEVWDAAHDEFLTVLVSPEADEAGVELLTNAEGVAQLYVFVDAFPEGADCSFDLIEVVVVMGDEGELFHLVPR